MSSIGFLINPIAGIGGRAGPKETDDVVDKAMELGAQPTETKSRETLDAFVDAMRRIPEEARDNPELLRAAPHKTPVRRLDEVRAARQLVLSDNSA